MKMSFPQILSSQLGFHETVTMDIDIDLLGRVIHTLTVENNKKIKSIKMMTDADSENILQVKNNTGDQSEILWEQKSLFLMETKFLMLDLIAKVKKANIHFSATNFENSPYQVKVSFSTEEDSDIFKNLAKYLSTLSEGQKIAYKAIGDSLVEFEAIPLDTTKNMLYDVNLGLSDVIVDLSRMGLVNND